MRFRTKAPRFHCERCDAGALRVSGAVYPEAEVCCSACGAVLGTWEAFLADLERHFGRTAKRITKLRDVPQPQRHPVHPRQLH